MISLLVITPQKYNFFSYIYMFFITHVIMNGAMLYVVVEELVPEASQGTHSNISTIGFAAGFALMMVLDVLLG